VGPATSRRVRRLARQGGSLSDVFCRPTPELESRGYRRFALTGRGFVAATITIAPIATDKVAEWRAFIAELRGSRRIEWAQSQRRRGINRQVITLADAEPPLAVVYTETGDVEEAALRLAESNDSFDVWYRRRVEELYDESYNTEVVFDSAPRPGPWRGWR